MKMFRLPAHFFSYILYAPMPRATYHYTYSSPRTPSAGGTFTTRVWSILYNIAVSRYTAFSCADAPPLPYAPPTPLNSALLNSLNTGGRFTRRAMVPPMPHTTLLLPCYYLPHLHAGAFVIFLRTSPYDGLDRTYCLVFLVWVCG